MNKFNAFTFAIFCGFVTACSQTQVETTSTVALPAAYDYAPQGQAVDLTHWWRQWQDPQLNRLIEQALANNLDIAIAKKRLQEAQAQYQGAEADQGIYVGVDGKIAASSSDLNSGLSNPKSSQSLGGLGGLSVSWEPDFFGQKQSDSDAAFHQSQSVQAQLYAAKLLIAAQVAENYLDWHASEQQRQLLANQHKVLQQLQRYVQGRFNAGQATAYNLNEIVLKITALEAQQATLQAQAVGFQQKIAILLGTPPQQFRLTAQGNPLAKIPNAPAGEQPQSLLERRPDLLAKGAQLKALAAKLASAKADLLPRFDLRFLGQGGRLELNNDLSHLSGLSNLISLGVQLPLFTNGRIDANIAAADARLQAAVLDYDKTLLQALAEVDSAYHLQMGLVTQTQRLNKAVQQAKQHAIDSEKLFKHGEKTLDTALDAQLTALNQQQQRLQSQRQTAKNLIGLYKALGGGWE